MKLKKLNDYLVKDKSIAVRLIFPPIILLVDAKSGIIITPTQDSADVQPHYSTIVYDVDNQTPAIFEFNQRMLSGLQGYASRYPNMADVELLLSREQSGALRITIGRKEGLELITDIQNKLAAVFSKLNDKYMAKIGYIVNDI